MRIQCRLGARATPPPAVKMSALSHWGQGRARLTPSRSWSAALGSIELPRGVSETPRHQRHINEQRACHHFGAQKKSHRRRGRKLMFQSPRGLGRWKCYDRHCRADSRTVNERKTPPTRDPSLRKVLEGHCGLLRLRSYCSKPNAMAGWGRVEKSVIDGSLASLVAFTENRAC